MERYSIYEGRMEDLMKKITRIQNKCKKFGCDFHFEQVGEELKEVKCPDGTVKEYDEFRGVKQTVLTRCKVLSAA